MKWKRLNSLEKSSTREAWNFLPRAQASENHPQYCQLEFIISSIMGFLLDQCYSGDQTQKTFDRFGKSVTCITGEMKLCTTRDKFCLGQCSSIFVSKFKGRWLFLS